MSDLDPKYMAQLARAQSALELLVSMGEVLRALEETRIKDGVRRVNDHSLSDGDAKALFIEIAAYRNIVRELEQRVESGRKAEIRATRELQS